MLSCSAPPSLRRSHLIGLILLWLSAAGSAHAICDVIPQPEILYRGETGALNRVYASPGDPIRISVDLAGCESGAGGLGTTSTSSNFESFTTEGWLEFGTHSAFFNSARNPAPGRVLFGGDGGNQDHASLLAPAEYLGDWLARGVTRLSWEHWTGFAAGQYIPTPVALVRIEGPGGVAEYQADSSEIQAIPFAQWGGGFDIPISSAGPTGNWQLISGSWAALLADVDELRILAELQDGLGDFYAIDNFVLHDAASPATTTLIFEPPSGPANAIVIPAPGVSCTAFAADLTACEASLGGGTAICRDDLAPDFQADSISFNFPDSVFVGPVTAAVSPSGADLPCALATTQCGAGGAPSGLFACIDTFYAQDGTCQSDDVNRHEQFPGLTVLPAPNDFSGICDSSNPSIPCNDSNADVQFTTDGDGNLLVPIDWRGVLVPGTLPIPRLVRASTSVAAFVGAPPEANQTPGAPIEVPGFQFLQSFSPKGLRVDPLFNPLANEDATTDTELFGSADAEFGVIRILRRGPTLLECVGGVRGGLACANSGQCPGSTCGGAMCRGGANDGLACTADSQCPSGECGSALFEFGDRYSNGGTGPVLLTSAEYEAEALNPVAIDGLAATNDLFMFVRSEPLEGADLNQDGDQTDATVVTLRDQSSNEDAGLGAVPGAVGRAGVRARSFPFRFPAVAVEDDVIAFLEAEPEEGGADANGDGDVFDTILRVFRLDTTPATEMTQGLAIATDADERIDRSSVAVSDGLVFFRRDESANADRASVLYPYFPSRLEMTGDGRFVAFGSIDTNLFPGDTNNQLDHFVLDRDPDQNGILDEVGTTLTHLTAAPGGGAATCGGGFCMGFTGFRMDISPDGRWVATTTVLALDPSDTNDGEDVYLHDRDTDEDGIFDEPGAVETILVSTPGAGSDGLAVGYPQISADGRHVVYFSFPDELPGDNNGTPDLYALDRDADEDGIYDEPGETTHEPLVPTGPGFGIGMSEDARYVTVNAAFDQAFVLEDTNNQSDVYLLDRDTDEDRVFDEMGATELTLVSANANGEVGNGQSNGFSSMNADGRYVYFQSGSGNLTAGPPTSTLYVRDRDPDENGIFDEPGKVEVRNLTAGGGKSSPSGRWLMGLVDRVDQETGLSEVLTPLGVNPGWPSDIGLRGAYVVYSDELTGDIRTDGIDTSDFAEDRNADGDLLDVVLAVADARQVAPIPVVDLGPADEVAVKAGNAVFLRPESADGSGVDLNGDLDADDRVVHLYRNRQLPVVNLGVAASAVAVSEEVVGALVSEIGEGVLLNGDADMDDHVVHVNDVATGTSGTWTNLNLAADAVQAAGSYVAFTVSEADQGVSLNGDGDLGDRVLRVYDAQTASLVAFQDENGVPIPGLAVDDFALTDGYIAFRVNEFGQGQNLNGVAPPIVGGVADGDLLDSVLHVADLATGTVYNGFQAAIPCPVEACDPRVPYRLVGAKATFLTLESQQGGNDLDQSGDGGIGLVLQHFNPDALAAGGSMLDACDVVGGALAGVCTNTAEACAGDADCGGETCYFPPGGCLFDTGNNCDPDAPACAAGEFCQPILGMPGQGTCQEFQGPCLDDGQCGGGAVCSDNGLDPEQLFAAVGQESDGRQRYVSLGRCSDGDGACGNDAECNADATCDVQRTVIATAADADADGLADPIDNCPDIANGDQRDIDQDGVGDACDRETCGNAIQEYSETCDHGDQNGLDGVCDATCLYEGGGAACADGIDNDGDGEIDLDDSGCVDGLDASERDPAAPCDDGFDNDGDYRSDFGSDAGCFKLASAREDPQCSDGIDNDNDGTVDWDGAGYAEPDAFCGGLPGKARERPPSKNCGAGAEIALLLPALWWLRRRRSNLRVP